MSRHPLNIIKDIYLCRAGMAHASGARYQGYRQELDEHTEALRQQVEKGQYWKVRVGGGRTMLGKVTKVAARGIVLVRVNKDGDEIGKTDELHVILAAKKDLAAPMEMDQYYGYVVPLGTAKRHICNRNID